MAQSKTLLTRLWSQHIEPLRSKSGGGANNLGFYYLDELITSAAPTLTKRGDTIFVLHPGNKNGIPTRANGHWTTITVKTKNIEYFDPAIAHNNVPPEIRQYLEHSSEALNKAYRINTASPQTNVSEDSKAFESCGLYCIRFLKNTYS